ncbi:fibronectin type III domain-containing protein 4-like isoform X2 [Cololabis saira]|uniref:fibronectin type III domain-containing protein 4-like isoform X2 n=1 Tax=Cololabis saira TaxID=129043 RepID=UPI002AD3E0F7|nr:fibronectin type III domain-containing protein 4-like isoform X2 [Cololabis saira]
MTASPHLDAGLLLLLLACCNTPGMVGGTVPAAPVNVSVTQLRAHSAMVTWNVPQGDAVIGYSISQQRQDGLMQRSIREVNTSSHWCVLWDLDELTHYSVQVQSVGLHGDSQPSSVIHFKTLERTDHYPAGVLDHRTLMKSCCARLFVRRRAGDGGPGHDSSPADGRAAHHHHGAAAVGSRHRPLLPPV